MQTSAYEIHFQTPDGIVHKTCLLRVSTFVRHGEEFEALDRAIRGTAEALAQAGGAQLLSVQRTEALGCSDLLLGAGQGHNA